MKLATIKEIAEYLKVKESTLYTWVGSGLIPSFKINGLIRFDMEEIEDWCRNSRTTPERAKIELTRAPSNQSVDKIVKKAIADTKKTRYTLTSGKPG